jgi:tetratricopeptide (TPR) repeat protein
VTTPDVDALYRVAHEAHFKARDYAVAVAAWDRYLGAAGPDSRMLIEARYNRGIALSRLGRRDEAVKALEPFANGEYGEYRQNEARRVIEKLRR